MKSALLFLALILSSFAVQAAESVTTITITTAQQDADTMARTGVLRHCRTAGGRLEGIGSGSSREQAIRNCCYWGRPYIEIGVARSIRTGRYFAVVRYK
jgi:hypothetical protein